ncbi:MAG: Spy/CpxP family protein refolding chaperone [Desulfobacterota bacterium]|nr:Spy/CpxP family protein refolding chaperone [Thermodesulfobacteriota bacterium]
MKKRWVFVSLMVLVILAAGSAYAYGPGCGPCWKGPWGEAWAAGKGVDLTPDQKAKLQELRQKFTSETAKLRGELLTKRLELQSLWTNPKADPKAIAEKERELRELQNQMREKGLQHRLEVRQILTPEQIAGFGFGRDFCPGPGFGPGPKRGSGFGWGRGPGQGPCF